MHVKIVVSAVSTPHPTVPWLCQEKILPLHVLSRFGHLSGLHELQTCRLLTRPVFSRHAQQHLRKWRQEFRNRLCLFHRKSYRNQCRTYLLSKQTYCLRRRQPVTLFSWYRTFVYICCILNILEYLNLMMSYLYQYIKWYSNMNCVNTAASRKEIST